MIIIKNGFEDRLDLSNLQKNFIFNKKDYENYSLESTFNQKFNQQKKKLIVVGNSHGKDFYDILESNSEIKKIFQIKYLNFSPECLQQYLKTNINRCIRTFDFNKKNIFTRQMDNFLTSDKVILSTRWSEADIDSLVNLNEFFKKNKIDLTVVSTAPEFNFKSKIYSNSDLKTINKQVKNLKSWMN